MQCSCPANGSAGSAGSQYQSRTEWQQQRPETPTPEASSVSWVKCNSKTVQRNAQRSGAQQSAPLETLYTQQQATPRGAYNTAFIDQLHAGSQWSPSTPKSKMPCEHCRLQAQAKASSTPRDAFNQGFTGQPPTDEQWTSRRQGGLPATPIQYNTGFSGEFPTHSQWTSQPSPPPQPRIQSAQRDVFNEVFIGPPSADNQWSDQPPRDVFNTGFCAELPTDGGQSISRRPKVVCKGGPPTAGNNEEFNQDFVGQLPTDKQFGNTANTLQMRSARDGFKEAFVRQSPTRLQTPTPRYYPWYHYRSQPSTDKQSRSRPPESSQPGAQRDVFNDAIVGQLPTDPQTPTPRYHIWYQPYSGQPSTVKQSKSRPPASSQPGAQRDVFNDAIVGQLPTDPQTPTPRYHPWYQPYSGQPSTDKQSKSRPPASSQPGAQRDIFNKAFLGQLPTDIQTPTSRYHPWYQPYSGQPSTDKQSKSRPPASSQPGAQRDIFNKAFLGQLPTDIQTPTSRYQPYSGHLPTDKQSRIRPPESRQPGTQNDVFNEAFMGELSTDPQPTQRPRSLSRDPLNEAFIRKSSTDNQSKGRIPCIAKSRSKRRDPLVIGQLPTDQSRLQTSYGVGSQSFSTPKAAFNRGFRGQLSVDVQSTPSRGGYKKADTGPSNPRLRLCGK